MPKGTVSLNIKINEDRIMQIAEQTIKNKANQYLASDRFKLDIETVISNVLQKRIEEALDRIVTDEYITKATDRSIALKLNWKYHEKIIKESKEHIENVLTSEIDAVVTGLRKEIQDELLQEDNIVPLLKKILQK